MFLAIFDIKTHFLKISSELGLLVNSALCLHLFFAFRCCALCMKNYL